MKCGISVLTVGSEFYIMSLLLALGVLQVDKLFVLSIIFLYIIHVYIYV